MPLTKERKQQLKGEFGRGSLRFGLAGGPDCAAHQSHRPDDRAFAIALQGLRQSAWPVGDGQSAAPVVGLREADQSRVVSRSVAASGNSEVEAEGSSGVEEQWSRLESHGYSATPLLHCSTRLLLSATLAHGTAACLACSASLCDQSFRCGASGRHRAPSCTIQHCSASGTQQKSSEGKEC